MLAEMLKTMLAYKAWANELTYHTVSELPPGEAQRPRQTRWESIAYTLSHVLVVDDIFKHHLQGERHSYGYRNCDERLDIAELWARQRMMDQWHAGFAAKLSPEALDETVSFEFVGGGMGKMTRAEILLHLVNHGTYHRGLVSPGNPSQTRSKSGFDSIAVQVG